MQKLLYNISMLVLPKQSSKHDKYPIDVIENAALLLEDGKVKGAGKQDEFESIEDVERIDIKQRALIPGFVDSHTHLCHAGERIEDMARRAKGETYASIAASGGGIAFSVKAFSETSDEDILSQSLKRLEKVLSLGTTTAEIKSGYGGSAEQEFRQLKLIEKLKSKTKLSLFATALAHGVPKTENDRAQYIQNFKEKVIKPAAEQKLASFLDVFVENNAHTAQEAAELAELAQSLGLKIKLHVDQLTNRNGAKLAAKLQALSADHLEFTDTKGAKALAEAGTIATILPGCKFILGTGPWPQAGMLKDAGCEVAIATDSNPGSCTLTNLPLCAFMTISQCGLTLEEALWGITQGGALALGLQDRGRLFPGERADFLILNHKDWRKIFYTPDVSSVEEVWISGLRI